MGTCYYLHERGSLIDRLATGGEERIRHIGKSSHGWCFSLRVYPGENINSLTDWYRRFRKNNNIIKDEYGYEISIEEMLKIIMYRMFRTRVFVPTARCPTEEAMLDMNQAVYGPHNLLRCKIGEHCTGHGPGTWDLMPGEFS